MESRVRRPECAFDTFCRWVLSETGIALDATHLAPLDRRLQRIFKAHRLRDLDDLAGQLSLPIPPALRQELIDAVTTQESSWFRDSTLFQALEHTILPRLLREGPLSIWSAGCAYGQEIYSLAMLLSKLGADRSRARLLATDISGDAVRRARAGRYLSLEVSRGLDAETLGRFFLKDGPEWEIQPELRTWVEFRRDDLRAPSGETFDLILCRHVLIYFDSATQKRTLDSLSHALRPGGYLALGNVESIRHLNAPLARTSIGGTSFYHRIQRMAE